MIKSFTCEALQEATPERRMMAGVLESVDGSSCDVISCSPAPPCVSLCSSQREDEESHCDSKKPLQQKQCSPMQPKKTVKAKGKLVRSMAVCEEPPPPEASQTNPNISSSCHDNAVGSCKEGDQEENTDPKTHSLSKESSLEYTDYSGIDLQRFIVDTLNSSPRERLTLLRLEQDMIDFINSKSLFKQFPKMSSYHRMLVHRVSAYFGMEHNVDQTGRAVIINRTAGTRIPERRFLDEVRTDMTEELNQWKSILKRDSSSEDQTRLFPSREKQSKSLEEREEEYQRARDRIFSQEPLCTQESVRGETRAVEECNPYAETQRRRQLFRRSRDSSGSSWTGSSRQSSTETDCRYSNDPHPWSSTDSDSSYQWTNPAPKPQQTANHSWEARGAGSIALFRVSNTCPHPPSPPIAEEPPAAPAFILENGIPPGSILVNPHTGQPFLNPDGTPIVYNPPDSQQPIKSQTQPPQQVVQYPPVSYAAPQMLPVTVSQPYTIDDLSSQFAQVSCHSQGEVPPLYPPSQGYIYAAPPPPPPNPHSYSEPSPQVPVYYYSQYPTSVQQPCKPVSPSHSQAGQPTAVYAPVMAVQQTSHSQASAMLGPYTYGLTSVQQPSSKHRAPKAFGVVPPN